MKNNLPTTNMNIKLVKQEIEQLTTLLSSWEEGKGVSAIERDLALNKLTKLYELIRFDAAPATDLDTNIIPPIVAPMSEEPSTEAAEEEAEQEIEVEIIFADEDQEDCEEETSEEMTIPEEFEIEEEEKIEEEASVEPENIIIQEPEVTPEVEPQPAEEEAEPEFAVKEEVIFASEDEDFDEEEEAEIVVVAEPVPEPQPVVAPEPQPVVESIPEPEPEPEPEKPAKSPRRPAMESLFGAEEIQRKPRSKHQRMMAIYGESQPKQEKAVDISKIFDMDDDDIFEIKVVNNRPLQESVAKKAVPVASEEVTTLADVIAPQKTTLADTMVAPAALAEEITNSRIISLQQAIGINDKFLMIRDLFDGDAEAYAEAISTLDKLPSLEDCMIHIIENYEWNPDVEGSKFIMQLLERKFS